MDHTTVSALMVINLTMMLFHVQVRNCLQLYSQSVKFNNNRLQILMNVLKKHIVVLRCALIQLVATPALVALAIT